MFYDVNIACYQSSSLFLIFSLSIYSFYLPQYRSILYHFPHTPSYIYTSLFIYFINPSLYIFPIKKGFITSSLFPPFLPQISKLSTYSLFLFPSHFSTLYVIFISLVIHSNTSLYYEFRIFVSVGSLQSSIKISSSHDNLKS